MIGHLFYATSSFVHHFKAISQFKLELQSRNAQFESKSAIFLSCVTLKFDRRPWKTIGHLFYATSSFVHHFVAIGQFELEWQSGNIQFWSKWALFCPMSPGNLMDDLEKQQGTSSMLHQDRQTDRLNPGLQRVAEFQYNVTEITLSLLKFSWNFGQNIEICLNFSIVCTQKYRNLCKVMHKYLNNLLLK